MSIEDLILEPSDLDIEIEGTSTKIITGSLPYTSNKHKHDDDRDNKRAVKKLKAFLAQREEEIYTLVAQCIYKLEEEEEEVVFIASRGIIDITIPITYNKAVNDLINS